MSLLDYTKKTLQVHQRRQADLVAYKKDTWVMVNPLHAFLWLPAWFIGFQDKDGSFSGNLVNDVTEKNVKGV